MELSTQLVVGDAVDLYPKVDDQSVNLVATSPPFLNLRDYNGDCRQVGLETSPADFLDTLLVHTAQWGRMLSDTGSLAVELGDTMAGSSFRERTFDARSDGWPDDGSLCLIPGLYAACLAYGVNVLTGELSPAGRWRVRNVVCWFRSNPPTGSLGDRYRFATSTVTIATQSKRRWFDLSAIRSVNGSPPLDGWRIDDTVDAGVETWPIPRQPSQLDHQAQWPPKLAERLIASMCPKQVCVVCGTPRTRLEQVPDDVREANREVTGRASTDGRESGSHWTATAFTPAVPVTTGWSDCGCGAGFVRGVVLDPFAGSGTTLAVAELLGRSSIGFELNADAEQLLPLRRVECRRTLLGSPPGRSFNPGSDDTQPSLFADHVEVPA